MKNVIAILLAAALLALPLTGCNSGGASSASPAAESSAAVQSSSSAVVSEPASEAPAAPEGSVNITHWEMVNGPATSYPSAAQGIVDRFNAENDQGIHVTLQMTPWDNFYQTFLTAVTSGAAPDTSTGASTQPTQYAAMDEILDLTPIVEQWNAEGSSFPSDLPAGWQEAMTYEGILTGIPWALDPRQITYRTDYFEQAGITELPTTWDEFLAVCAAIKEKTDAIPFVFGGADQMSTQTIMYFLFQNGTGLTSETVEADFTNPRVVETLDFLGKLYANQYISEGTASYKSADAEKMYCSGTAAMWFGGPPAVLNDYPDIAEASAIMKPLKGPSGGIPQNYIWMNSIMAYTQTDEPEACHAFIKYWIENMLVLWTEGQCSQVPSVSAYSKDQYFQDIWYQKEIAEKVIPTAVPTCYPASSLYPAFSQIEGENYPGAALQAVITGRTDYEAIASEANDKIAKALEDFGSSF